MSCVGCPYGFVCVCVRVCVCAGLTGCTDCVWKNIYHCPKQESSQGVLNGPACLEKPFSKWMPLCLRVSDRNLPRAMPARNKIASLCAPFLFMRSLFSHETKKNVKCVQIISGFVLHGGTQVNQVECIALCSVPAPGWDVIFCDKRSSGRMWEWGRGLNQKNNHIIPMYSFFFF